MACNNCKYHENIWGHNEEYKFVLKSRVCKLDHTEEMNRWWNENGHKTIDDDVEQLPCAEETDGAKMLGKMIELTEKMLEVLKENKD